MEQRIDQLGSEQNQPEVIADLEEMIQGDLDGLHKTVLADMDAYDLKGFLERPEITGGAAADTLTQMMLDYFGIHTTDIDALTGKGTRAGVKQFQEMYNQGVVSGNLSGSEITADGIMGPMTWGAMKTYLENLMFYVPKMPPVSPPTQVVHPEAPVTKEKKTAPDEIEGGEAVSTTRQELDNIGYSLRSSGEKFKEDGTSRASNRTSIDGLKSSTVEGMKHMMTWLNLNHPGSQLVITGLAEQGPHANGEFSHGNGYKFDLSRKGKSKQSADNLIALAGVTKGGPRKFWKFPGNEPFGDQEQWIGIAREDEYTNDNGYTNSDHLDIVVYPPGHSLSRDEGGRVIDDQEKVERKSQKKDLVENSFDRIQATTKVDYDRNKIYKRKEYIALITPLAQEIEGLYAERGFSLPAAFLIKQSIAEAQGKRVLENGTSDRRIPSLKAKESNNFFGITANKHRVEKGGAVFESTDQDKDGKGIDQNFRQYGSIEESFMDYANMVTTGKYKAIFEGDKSVDQIIEDISGSGYAANPSYGDLLRGISVSV